MHSSLFGGKDDQGNALPGPGTVGWGNYLGATIASVIPDIALAIVPQAVVGRAAGWMLGAASKATGLATSAGVRA